MTGLDHVQFVRHRVSPIRRHYVDEEDVKVVLSRLPAELWARLRKVHFKDDARGHRRFGYTTRLGRREISLCALPHQVTINRRILGSEEFGAVRGSQWPVVAVRRYLLYDTLLHELGHLQIVLPKSANPNRKFASETLAQEFADTWRRRLWSAPFDHPDPVHNAPSKEELRALKDGWIKANLAYRKGQALYASGKPREALPHLKRAAELYPEHALALQLLGELTYYGCGSSHPAARGDKSSLREAVVLLRRSLAVDPTLPNTTLILAVALDKLDEQDESRRFFSHAMRLDPYGGWVRSMYADALSRWGRTDEAETQFKRLVRAWPENDTILTGYAVHLLKRAKGKTESNRRKAIELLEKAVQIDPKAMPQHSFLGLAYSLVGNRNEDAIKHLREALRLDPDNKSAAQLLAKLTASGAT
jgi:tetratricopeptide (TPR) repeat protein